MPAMSEDSMEGRLLAHRHLLALIVAGLEETPGKAAVLALLAERSVFQNSEEDPGAVPSPAHGIELAFAEEMRLIADKAREDST